jgi:hypothetical protein
MSGVKKYRLGNQPEEYEFSEEYLKWRLEGYSDWKELCDKFLLLDKKGRPATITLVSPDGKKKVTLNLFQILSKDAFPLSFHGEERAKNWWIFLKVSASDRPEEMFIVPVHPLT